MKTTQNIVLSEKIVLTSFYFQVLISICSKDHLSLLMLWGWIPLRWDVLNITLLSLCDKVCQWLAAGRWFSPVLRFPPPIKLTPRYNWNIVESGIDTITLTPLVQLAEWLASVYKVQGLILGGMLQYKHKWNYRYWLGTCFRIKLL